MADDRYIKSSEAWQIEREWNDAFIHDLALCCKIFFFGAVFGVITTLLLMCGEIGK